MAITLTQPIVVPPTPQLTADKVWILTLNINATAGPNAPIGAYVSMCPMVSSTGELLQDQMQDISIQDFLALAQADTTGTLSGAFSAICTGVQTLCKNNGLFGMSN